MTVAMQNYDRASVRCTRCTRIIASVVDVACGSELPEPQACPHCKAPSSKSALLLERDGRVQLLTVFPKTHRQE